MSNLYQRLRTLACACVPLLLISISHASATTIALENGASETNFSIDAGYHDTLSVSPVININSNGCPGAYCSNSFWNVGLTIDFFGPTESLLATYSVTVAENCISGSCTVPRSASFEIPDSATNFEIFNTVNVGGGWSYNFGSEFISTGSSDIAETPIPASVLLFSAGLAMFSLLAFKRKDRKSELLSLGA
jgi:hypothetical protein